MGRVGYITITLIVVALHVALLKYRPHLRHVTAKPDAKVCHITLSRVAVRKPPPPLIPPSPQVEPVKVPQPRVKPPEPKKPVVKKRVRKKRVPKKVRKKAAKRVKKVVRKRLSEPRPPQKKVTPPAPVTAPARMAAPQERINTATVRDRYITLIRQKIKASLIYPKIARRMRMQGEVDAVFVVYADGHTGHVRIVHAPRKVLANAAKQTIEALDLPPIPKALGTASLKVSVPIEFKLKG